MENKKKLIEVIPVSEGWLNKYIFSYELDDGSTYSYEVISREKINSVEDAKRIATKDNAVTIIPFTEDGHLVLTKEYHYPVNDYIWEFPAGLIDAGEDAKAAAIREMKEETGLDVVEIMDDLPGGYSSAGMTNERVAVVVCKVKGEIKNAEGKEEIYASKFNLYNALQLISSDSKFSGRFEFFLTGLRYGILLGSKK